MELGDNTCKMKAMGNYRDPYDPPEEEWGCEPETRVLVVDAIGHGQRLDKVLAMGVPEFSRNYLKRAIEDAQVVVQGHPALSPSKKVLAGQRVEVQLLPTAQSQAFRGEPVPMDVVFEDEHILVIHKPAGLVVHPGAGNWSGTLLNGLLFRDPPSSALPRAGIVHRLDKDTSGLMVVGRTLQAVTELTRQIAAREVHREYLALAHGHLQHDHQVQARIGRDPGGEPKWLSWPRGNRPKPTSLCWGTARMSRPCAACCTPDAPTKFGSIWPTWGIHWWEIRLMAGAVTWP